MERHVETHPFGFDNASLSAASKVRGAAWAAWGPTPDAMTRGPININADLDDDAGSADRIAAAYPVLDFVQADQFHTEIYEVTPFIYEGHYFGLPAAVAVSRRGLVPRPHALGLSPAEPSHRPELDEESTARDYLRAVRRRVKSVEASGGNWRQVVDSLRPLPFVESRSVHGPLRVAQAFAARDTQV